MMNKDVNMKAMLEVIHLALSSIETIDFEMNEKDTVLAETILRLNEERNFLFEVWETFRKEEDDNDECFFVNNVFNSVVKSLYYSSCMFVGVENAEKIIKKYEMKGGM